MPDRIAYKIDKAAEVIGLSRSTLYADMHAGILPFLKRKRSRRILHSDLVKYALAMKVKVSAEGALKGKKISSSKKERKS